MKNLYDFGEGILRTHVTWEALQEKCKEILGESAIFGENKSVSSIGDGRGFMSKMCLIDPDWHEDVVPRKFVVKVACLVAMSEAHEKMRLLMPEMDTPEMRQNTEQMQKVLETSVRKMHNTNVYEMTRKYAVQFPHIEVYASVPISDDNTDMGYLIMVTWTELLT